MIRDYFEYKGVKYYSGAVISVKPIWNCPSWVIEGNAVFVGYNTETNKYIICAENDKNYYLSEDHFYSILINVINNIDNKHKDLVQEKDVVQNNKMTFSNEMSIDGMFLAWVWYIFIMLITVIFKERIGIWIFMSIIFFGYRNKKLKERGYK